ncbi:MAG: restriction endonuclease subunit S [Planctomycetota bacterium]|jgi:type I restriction enzyme S subunit
MVPLSKICSLQNGRAFKKTEWAKKGKPIIRIQNLNNPDADFNYYDGEYDPRIEVSNGDLLFSWSGTVGSSFGPHIWGRETGVLNQHIFKVILDHRVHLPYMYYALRYITADIEKRVQGAVGLVHITKTKLSAFEIPLPPLPEQIRIVAILDQAFSSIDQAKSNIESNITNAGELFESRLNDSINRLAESNPSEKLARLCGPNTITYGVIKLGRHIPDGTPCLRTSNVRRLRIDRTSMKCIEPSLSRQYGRTILQGDEILVAIRGTLGGVAVVEPDMVGWNVSREVAVVPADTNRVIPEFAAYCIAAKKSQDWLTGVLKGAAYTGINLTDLRNLTIPVPAKRDQLELVEKLDCFSDHCSRLTEIYERKLTELSDLQTSILSQGFSGQLNTAKTSPLIKAIA